MQVDSYNKQRSNKTSSRLSLNYLHSVDHIFILSYACVIWLRPFGLNMHIWTGFVHVCLPVLIDILYCVQFSGSTSRRKASCLFKLLFQPSQAYSQLLNEAGMLYEFSHTALILPYLQSKRNAVLTWKLNMDTLWLSGSKNIFNKLISQSFDYNHTVRTALSLFTF